MILAAIMITLSETVTADNVVHRVLGILALAFAGMSIPGAVIWVFRTLLILKRTGEETSVTMNGPMGVVAEIQRIRTNIHKTNALLTTHIGTLEFVKREVDDIKAGLSNRMKE